MLSLENGVVLGATILILMILLLTGAALLRDEDIMIMLQNVRNLFSSQPLKHRKTKRKKKQVQMNRKRESVNRSGLDDMPWEDIFKVRPPPVGDANEHRHNIALIRPCQRYISV